jgi:DNA repair ATPase RecN
MDESFDSPRQVYRRVATEIDHILVRLGETSNDAKVADAQANAKRVLDEFRPTIDLAIAQLEKDVEWDTFTIALYGETNAGKSTVIETLRILLGEQTKKQSRAEFQRLMTEIGGEDELERLRVMLSATQSEAGALRDEESRLHVSQATEEETLRHDFRRLQEAIAAAKASASIWQKLLSAFRKLPEELQATVVSRRIEELLAAHRAASQLVDARRRNVEGCVAELTAQIEASERSLSELAEFADGGIIGNGRLLIHQHN